MSSLNDALTWVMEATGERLPIAKLMLLAKLTAGEVKACGREVVTTGKLIDDSRAVRADDRAWNARFGGRGEIAPGSRKRPGAIDPEWWGDIDTQIHWTACAISRPEGRGQQLMRQIILDDADLARAWPSGQSAATAAPDARVSQAELLAFVKERADGSQTEKEIEVVAVEHFSPKTFSRSRWREVWREVPSNLKVPRGGRHRSLSE